MTGIGCANSGPRRIRCPQSRGTRGVPLSTGWPGGGPGAQPGVHASARRPRGRDASRVLPLDIVSSPPAWGWPLTGTRVIRAFEPATGPYGPGHRGLDLAGQPSAPVRAVADGVVAFVGEVGGVPVVSLDHGRIRSTYQPVIAEVRAGDRVHQGMSIGTIAPGHEHCAATCVHLGARLDDGYLDPMRLLAARRVVLKPLRPVAVRLADAPG